VPIVLAIVFGDWLTKIRSGLVSYLGRSPELGASTVQSRLLRT